MEIAFSICYNLRHNIINLTTNKLNESAINED